jgi:hypothetical protein
MKKPASFLIDIVDTQNHTWQGRLYWVQEQKTITFRSALELMQLLSSAVTPEEAISIADAAEEREAVVNG